MIRFPSDTVSCGHEWLMLVLFNALVPRSLTRAPDEFDESELSIHCSDISVCGSKAAAPFEREEVLGKKKEKSLKNKKNPLSKNLNTFDLWRLSDHLCLFQPPYPPPSPTSLHLPIASGLSGLEAFARSRFFPQFFFVAQWWRPNEPRLFPSQQQKTDPR